MLEVVCVRLCVFGGGCLCELEPWRSRVLGGVCVYWGVVCVNVEGVLLWHFIHRQTVSRCLPPLQSNAITDARIVCICLPACPPVCSSRPVMCDV